WPALTYMKEYFPGQDSYNYRVVFLNKIDLFSFQMNQKRNEYLLYSVQ
ncbi:hypothetical protein EC3006_5303, partial [Escherichia coli 3006]